MKVIFLLLLSITGLPLALGMASGSPILESTDPRMDQYVSQDWYAFSLYTSSIALSYFAALTDRLTNE